MGEGKSCFLLSLLSIYNKIILKVVDKDSGGVYWWNRESDETTEIGASKPSEEISSSKSSLITTSERDEWIEVKDPATDGVYYWNKATNQTTPVGVSKPSGSVYYPPLSPQRGFTNFDNNQKETPTFGQQLLSLVIWGFGMSIGISIIRMLLGESREGMLEEDSIITNDNIVDGDDDMI